MKLKRFLLGTLLALLIMVYGFPFQQFWYVIHGLGNRLDTLSDLETFCSIMCLTFECDMILIGQTDFTKPGC